MSVGLFERARNVVRARTEPAWEMKEFSRAIRQMAFEDGRSPSVLIEDARFIRRASKWMTQETAHFWSREGAIGFVLAALAECA